MNHQKSNIKPNNNFIRFAGLTGLILMVVVIIYLDKNYLFNDLRDIRITPKIDFRDTTKTKQDGDTALESNKDLNTIPGLFPQGSQRKLSSNDLIGLSKKELKIMRNEIYARHGYKFKTKDMRLYFSNQPWYNEKHQDVTTQLSAIEIYNIEIINQKEQE